MKIQKDSNGNFKHIENKTWNYLVPSLRAWGDEFVTNWNKLYKVATGLYDYNLQGTNKYTGNNIFCLIDNKDRLHKNYTVAQFINYCQTQPCYVASYPYKSLESNMTMIVFKIHPEFDITYEKFLQGKYSEMYDKKTVDLLFPVTTKKQTKQILEKDYEAFQNFQEKFYATFNANIEDRSVEYDLPLINKEEIFNFNKDKPKFFTQEIKIW